MLLTATNIHKKFFQGSTELHILKGLTMSIYEGDVISVVGPSGAGKSTFLHILGGLDRPTDGEVGFEGKSLYKLNDPQRAQVLNHEFGFVFQFYHLLPEFSALENVLIPAMVKDRVSRKSEHERRALQLLDQVGLSQRASHRPTELSGGEQQRVAIARALMNRPKIIFCDEPTGNLDSQSGQGIISLLLSLNAEYKQTLVIVTHDEQVARKSKRTVYIKDGKLKE